MIFGMAMSAAHQLAGTLAWERILVPFLHLGDLDELLPVLEAMAGAGHPHITFQYLLYSDAAGEEVTTAEQELNRWLEPRFCNFSILPCIIPCQRANPAGKEQCCFF